MGFPVATRVKCTTCGAELLVVEAGEGTAECCGASLVTATPTQATAAERDDGNDD